MKAWIGSCAALILTAPVASHAAITSFSAELTSNDWPASEGGPARGNASIALDDSTNELSWEIQWAGTSARQARITMRGPDSELVGGRGPLVLDLAKGESTQEDVRGGGMSGSVQLTPRQAEEFSGENWQVEVRLVDKRGLRLTGKLELEILPPGVWL